MLVYFKSGYERLLHRFPGRALEWQNALILSTVGWVLLLHQEPPLFSRSYFYPMAQIAPQYVWAYGALGIGLMRVVFLFVNGALPRTSSYLRAIGAFTACFYWFTITFGLAGNEFVSLGMAAYSWLLLGDMYSLHRASTDMRLADNMFREKKNAGTMVHGTYA